jgi:hypothetical protein
MPDDVVSILRYQLKRLALEIKDYLNVNADADLATKAHLDSCSDNISGVLKAVYLKEGR